MKTTYLKCAHGNLLISIVPCKKCEEEKISLFNGIITDKKENKRIPIYRGCSNSSCFCTGRCKEIVGYNEPD